MNNILVFILRFFITGYLIIIIIRHLLNNKLYLISRQIINVIKTIKLLIIIYYSK
jgi:hypothetical protein